MVSQNDVRGSASVKSTLSSWPTLPTLLVSPLLYGMIIPLVFLDLCLEMYHRVAFPILGLSLVHRSAYIRIDRHRMKFLPLGLKVACAYCGYANGLLQYAARIAAETEAYFCPSKHERVSGFHAPPHHEQFAEYNDEAGFVRRFHQGRLSDPTAQGQASHRSESDGDNLMKLRTRSS